MGTCPRKTRMESTVPVVEYPVDEWFTGQYSLIPERRQEALKRYVIDRVPPGNFLTAIITNDLRGAFWSADDENARLVGLYVRWFYNVPPGLCHGNRQAMDEWLAKRDA